MSAQAAPGDMRIVSGLVSRIVQRLPCNSGIRLSMLETDVGLRSSLDALLQLASLRPSSVLQCLASALDSLARYSSDGTASNTTLDALQSQLYILHVVDTCLTEIWRQHSERNPPPLMDLPRAWPEPPALDDQTARQLLGTALTYARFVSSEANLYPGAASPAPSKDGRGQASSIVSWGNGSGSRSSSSTFSPTFIRQHSYTKQNDSGSKTTTFSSRVASNVDAVGEMTRLVGQIVFFLSTSNWPLVLIRIKGRLAHLTTTIEDTPDLLDLRLLEWSNMNRQRIGQVLQEASNSFLHIKRPAQIAFAASLHSAIWNWLEVNPIEFDMLVESNRKLEGGPDGLFDMLFSMSDFSSANAKRAAVFYPLMATLLIVCPDLFKRVINGEARDKSSSSSLAKKYSFLESLRKGLSGNKGFEPSVACYLDFIKAATTLAPRHDQSGLRSLVPDIQGDLKDALFFGSHSNDLTETRLPVEGLVALYRAGPRHINSTVLTRLWTDSDISKLIAVRACARMHEEADRLPWHPSMSSLRADVASQIRSVLKASINILASERGGTRRGRVSTDTSPALLDLIYDILSLFEADPNMALAAIPPSSASRSADTIGQALSAMSTLLGHGSDEMRTQAKQAIVAILERLLGAAQESTDVVEQIASAGPAAWQALMESSRQVLIAFHSGDSLDLAVACEIMRDIASVVKRLADLPERLLGDRSSAKPAVTVAILAILTSLAGPDVEQTALSTTALADLASIVRRVHGVSMETGASSDDSEAMSQVVLLESLSKLPPATGRQQQQRLLRKTLRQYAQPSDILSAVWLGLSHRLRALMSKMGRTVTESSHADATQARRLANAPVLAEDETKEWLNLNALVGAVASCGIGPSDRIRLSDLVGRTVLPSVYDERLSVASAIDAYINDSANLLLSSSVVIRESVKEALGNELPLSLGRNLVSALYEILAQSVGPNGITLSDPFTILADQTIAVLRLMIERMQPGDPQFDVTEIVFLLARYLNRLGRDDASLRVKMRFCQMVEFIVGKDEMVAAPQDGLLRNTLLEHFSEWSFDAQKDADPYQTSNTDRSRAQRDLDYSCLCALLSVTDGLVIKSTTDTSDDTPMVVKARLFQRYLHHLQKIIERPSLSDDTSARTRTASSGSYGPKARTEEPSTLAMLILSNLLAANIDVGLKHCLALGYHEDPLFRSAFIQVMSRLLRTGARFGGLNGTKHQANRSVPYLNLLANDNLAFAVAICEVCPGPEVDEMLALLFRSLEAKGTLLGLVKVMIEKEVAQTNHESELFRANTTTTKMLTVFGKTYGYNYVRATLQPLIHTLVDKPAACSFELDPTKAGPNENIEQNADHLRYMCQALLDLICSSASRVPVMFRALCHQLWEIVEDRFPDSRHSAVGSFIFLRFFCPAIISPESVDLDVSPESREVRRALLLITKVIQNLANNVKFKEPHMQSLNPFLAENIKQVTRFLSDIATRPRSWELAQAVKSGSDETSRSQDAEVDNLILHRFVFKQFPRINTTLETMPPSYRRSITPRSARADIDGKAALHRLMELMRSEGEPAVANVMTSAARNLAYTELMRQNQGRDTTSVAPIFYEGPASQNGRRIFYFVVSEIGLVDYDLLAFHIFTILQTAVESFDVVIDLTDYSPAVDLPKFWLQRVVQMAPQSLIPLVNVIALYNANSYAKKRVKRIISELVPLCGPVGKMVMAACSPSELAEAIPFTNLYLPDYTMALAYQADHVFTNLLRLSDHESHVPTVVKLGTDSLQVASWRKQDIAPGVKAYIIDVVRLKDIDDIVTGSGSTADHLTVKYSQNESVVFVSRKRNELGQMIRAARARLRTSPSEERTLRPSDVPGSLLNIALLNLSASDESLRLEAYNLINDVAKFFTFELRPLLLNVKAGLTIPTNSINFARDLSTGLAKSAPQLTLEFLREWAIGFTKADLPQKTACLLYVKPWVSNLNTFAKRSRDDSQEAIKQIGEIIRSLFSITLAERKRLHLSIQEHIWAPMAGSHDLADILLPALLEAAIDGGLGSDRVECVGGILCSISSTAIRGKAVARLRKTIAQTYLKPSATLSDNVAWAEICALTRLNLMLSFTPSDSLDSALFLPEIIHVLTLLVGSGPLLMRQTVYGLFVNTLQSLASSSPSDGVDGTALQQALDKAQMDDMMSCFDLVTSGRGLDVAPGSTQRDDTDMHLLDHVDTLARFLGDVLVAAAPNFDCANAWRARWMGLVVGTCFQHNPATQPQAFTVLGYLAADEVDDDLVYQILVAMSTSLSHMTENDGVLLNSMLRCLSEVIPGLLPDSRYASSLFWLAFAIAEMGYIPLFGAALELMLTALKALNEDPHVDRVPRHLLDTRRAMGEAARKIDQIAGISLSQDPSFCLVAIILKGVRHPSTSKIAKDVLLELLRLNTQQAVPAGVEDEGPLIGRGSVAYFTALLPVSANSVEDMRALFVAAGLEVNADSLKDLSQLSVFDLLAVPDNSSAIFLVALIATSLNSASTDAERLVLYRLLADASSEMPEVLSMAYDSLLPRLMTTLTTSSHPALVQNATTILSRALTDPSYTIPTGAPLPTDSQTSLQQSFQGSISSMPGGLSSGGPLLGVLDDLGMRGLSEGAFTPVKTDRLSTTARWVAALIESFTL